MEIFVRILAQLFVRQAYYKIKEKQNAVANALALMNMRIPQLESGVFSANDSYLLAASLQKRLEIYGQSQTKKAPFGLNNLNLKLEYIKQNSFSKLDIDTQKRLQAEAERLSYLPDLALLVQGMDGSLESQAKAKKSLRNRGGILMFLAVIAFVVLFALFDTKAPESITNSVVIGIFCVVPIILLAGIVFLVQGNIGKSELDTKLKARTSLESIGNPIERIYGADKSRYPQIYEESIRALDALLQRCQYQDLRDLYQV